MPERSPEEIRRVLYHDPCCYHATLATVLRWLGCGEPALVIGAGCSTNARLAGDELQFIDSYPALAAMCEGRGHGCTRRPATRPGDWEVTLGRLDRGRPVIGLLDPYYLSYYWLDYQRTHTQHALIFWAFDRASGRVTVSDPSETFDFVGTLPLDQVRASWSEEDRGQSWLDLEPSDRPLPGGELLLGEVRELGRALTAGGELLSGAGLARRVAEELGLYLELAERVGEPDARLGTDERRRRNSHFLRGIWNFSHTLRWAGRFVEAAARSLGSPLLGGCSAEVERLGQSWLVVRNLLVKYGLSSADRRSSLAGLCSARVAQIVVDTEAVARHLGEAVDDASGRSPYEALLA